MKLPVFLSAEFWSTLLQSATKKTWITTCTPILRCVCAHSGSLYDNFKGWNLRLFKFCRNNGGIRVFVCVFWANTSVARAACPEHSANTRREEEEEEERLIEYESN